MFTTELSVDTAEILETRAVDGTDQQEYFVHYFNCKIKIKILIFSKEVFSLVDHRNDQWIPENRLTSVAANEQTELTNEQLNDSTNSLTGRKRARLKRRLNDVKSFEMIYSFKFFFFSRTPMIFLMNHLSKQPIKMLAKIINQL